MSILSFEILAPDRPPLRFQAREVLLPGAIGVFSVRPGHTPLLTQLMPGAIVIYEADGKKHFYAQAGGFAEIKDDHVTVLVEIFEHGPEIDLARAESSLERAEKRIKEGGAEHDVTRAESALSRAVSRIQAHHATEY